MRPRDLPEAYADFTDYVRTVEREVLAPTESVRTVLATLRAPKAPPVPHLGEGAWRIARWPATRAADVLTRGLLGSAVRGRLDLTWSRADRARFEVLAAVQRASSPLLPRAAREFGPTYLHLRRDALAELPH